MVVLAVVFLGGVLLSTLRGVRESVGASRLRAGPWRGGRRAVLHAGEMTRLLLILRQTSGGGLAAGGGGQVGRVLVKIRGKHHGVGCVRACVCGCVTLERVRQGSPPQHQRGGMVLSGGEVVLSGVDFVELKDRIFTHSTF